MKTLSLLLLIVPNLVISQTVDLPSIMLDYQTENFQGKRSANAPDEIDQFAFMIGEWDVIRQSKNPDGSYNTAENNAYWRASYVLNGAAILDEWKAMSASGEQLGFTVRTYDEQEKEWVCMWYDNAFDKWIRYTAKRRGDSMVMHGTSPPTSYQGEGGEMRITFHDIEEDSFHWRMDWKSGGTSDWDIGRVTLQARRLK